MDHVAVTIARTTPSQGGLFDNRPTFRDLGAGRGIVLHDTPGFSLDYADDVLLKDCAVTFEGTRQSDFSHALEAHDCTGLKLDGFKGEAAHPSIKAVDIS
jgi:hypothetical protein